MLATRLVLIGVPSPDHPKSCHCYFVNTFCEDRINTCLILILILICEIPLRQVLVKE